MTTTYRFEEVRMTRLVSIHCPECGKKRMKTLARTYYRNGFHNESETRAKYQEKLAEEAKKLESSGLICNKCEHKDDPPEQIMRAEDLREGDRLFRNYRRFHMAHDFIGVVREPGQKYPHKSQRWIQVTTYHVPVDPITLRPLEPEPQVLTYTTDHATLGDQFRVMRDGKWVHNAPQEVSHE